MKTQEIKDAAGLMAFAKMSQSEKEMLWDAILNLRLSLFRLRNLQEMRKMVSDMIDDGASFGFSTSVYKKAELDGQIIGEGEVFKAAEMRLEQAMRNADLVKEFPKLIKSLLE